MNIELIINKVVETRGAINILLVFIFVLSLGRNNQNKLPSEPLHILFHRIAAGDHHAYEAVYEQLYDSLFAVAMVYGRNRELAEDAVQQVFMKLWERRDSLAEVDNPEAWLHTAARYQVMNILDKEFTRLRYLQNAGELLLGENTIAPDAMVKEQQEKIINRAVESLPGKQQQIYRWGREEGLTYAEIAIRTGLARETVKDYMAQALKALREILSRHKDEFISVLILFSLVDFTPLP